MDNSVNKWLRAGALASLVSSPLLLADDTEIYLGVGADEQAKPMVMLTLDLRPNLGSTVCSDVTSTSCLNTLAPANAEGERDTRLYEGIDLLTFNSDDTIVPDVTIVSEGADGYPDYDQAAGADGVLSDAEKDALFREWDGMNATLFDILRAAFQVVLTEEVILSGKMKLGMMITHDDNNQCGQLKGPEAIPDPNDPAAPTLGCSNGAYVLKGFFNPSAIDPDTKKPVPSGDLINLFERLAAIPDPSRGNYSNPYQLKEMYFEFYRYILGGDMYSGWLGYEDFASDDRTKNLHEEGDDLDYPLAPDPNTYVGDTDNPADLEYVSPFETAGDWACSALYMVNTASGEYESGRDTDADAAMDVELGLGSKPVAVDIISALADTDLASATRGSNVVGDQFVKSYFIVDGPTRTENQWAQAGKTDVALDLGDPSKLIDQLSDLLGGIISESSSLVSASVPANVYNRAETLDNLFLAIFQAEKGPRWPGNIKKLKIVAAPEYEQDADGNDVLVALRAEIQDTAGNRAFSSEDGRIKHSALTYWTDATGTDVTPANCTDGETPLEEEEFCGKDGRSVERGGAGQQIPGFLTDGSCSGPGELNSSEACSRQLFTESPASANTLIDFNYDAPTADALKSYLDQDAADADEAQQVIGWARGLFDRAVDGTASSDIQRWMMGDAIHSKPLAINFGDTDGENGYSRDNPNIHLFFGTNDGWFRSVKNTNSGGTESGEEAWAFMPLEVMHKQQVLSRDSRTRSEDFHPYGVDSQPVALVIDNDADGNVEIGGDDNDKVYVYFGLRRGGKAYYALDVTNPTGKPSMLWKITNADSDFSELGLTFSTPQVARVNYDGTQKNVLIFTAGYNGGWDANGAARIGKDNLAELSNPTEDSAASGGAVGTAVYVVDAVSGKLLWKATGSSTVQSQAASANAPGVYTHADLDYSMPSDITVVDTNQNGVADRAYVGDVGGNVWRIDLPEYGGSSDSRDTWQVSRLAALGAGSSPGIVRFFHAPDVILARDKRNAGTPENPLLVNRRYIGVAIGSGNRAYPKSDMDNVNYMYYLKDPITRPADWTPIGTPGNPSAVASGGLLDITDCASGDESACGFNNALSKIANLSNGWALELEEDGEKSLSKPITIQGTTFFTTYLPEGTSTQETCAPALGTGRIYALNLGDGTAALELDDSIDRTAKTQRFTDLEVPGIPPEPPFITTSGIDCPECDGPLPPGIGTSPGALVLPGGDILNINGRFIWKSYWREAGVDK